MLTVVSRLLRCRWTAAVALAIASGPAVAQDNFYDKKSVNLYVASAPGGGYDAQARLLARHLGRYVPGAPTFVVQNMPGGGGIVAGNTLYNIAPKDGSVMALLQRTSLPAKLLIGENVNFDVSKMSWIGSLASEPGVLMVWHTSPVKTTEDLFKRELIVGGAGAANDSELTPRLVNALLGTKMKIVSGYQSATAISLAMERGEVEAIPDWSWSNAKALKAHYLRDKTATILMQFGLTRLPDLPNVPTPLELAKSDDDRRLLSIYLAPREVSRPVAMPPGVPADRLAVVRTAFMKLATDAEFVDDAKKSKLLIDLADHKAVEKVVGIITKASPDDAKRFRTIFDGS